MVIVGSRAMKFHNVLSEGREVNDWDFICTFSEFRKWTRENKLIILSCTPLSDNSYHVRLDSGMNYEFEIAWEGSSGDDLLNSVDGDYLSPSWQLAMKLSHRYLKNSPHFLKTMKDIQHLRNICELDDNQKEWLKKREIETYTYKHPRLDRDKEAFFNDDGIRYVYDHDSIHETIALLEKPAYTNYSIDGEEVLSSKDKFFSCPDWVRLNGVYEETCVLALERSQIPYDFSPEPRKSFEKALMKVCTSITSGWFREFSWENYDKVLALYIRLGENDYIKRFNSNKHLLRAYK